MAIEPLATPPVRSLHLAELAGDPEQPPVRGRRGVTDRLELRRVGGGDREPRSDRLVSQRPARCLAFCPEPVLAVGGLFVWVATGGFYVASREGRTIGLGEEPLWYPHEAVKFAGGPGMPDRFLGFHIGHAALYEYPFAPGRKVYIDPRLEVMGADLFERYINLEKRDQQI